jgi:hypothetical protein
VIFNIKILSINLSERIIMNKSMRFVLCLLGLATVLSFSGCQSTPKQEAKSGAPTASSGSENITAKQQEYDQMLQEWKTLKPGLKRMLAIEEEMNLLIGQLALLQNVNQSQSAKVSSSAPTPAAPITPTAPPIETSYVSAPAEPVKLAIAPAPAPAPAPSDSAPKAQGEANYSLQVASLTELKLLPKRLQEIQRSHPQLADLTPNYQSIKVNNTTYHRLKIGAFSNLQEANKKCNELIAVGVSCIPSKYTESNFAQI